MPKRDDIQSVLVIGSRADRHRPGLRVRLLRHPGVPGAARPRASGSILVNSNPATIMTDPEFADATYVEPITPEFVEKVIAKERPDALLATLGGQTALNTAMALRRGRRAREVRRRADRRQHRGDRPRREPRVVQEDRRGARRRGRPQSVDLPHDGRLPRRRPTSSATRWWCGPSFTMGGTGSGHGLRRGRPAPHRRRRPRRQPDHRGAPRGVDPRLEGVRARGDARHRPTTS